MPILASEALLYEKKNPVKNVTPSGNRTQEVMRGPGSIPTGGNIFHWIFLFSRSTASDANIGPTLFNYEKPRVLGTIFSICYLVSEHTISLVSRVVLVLNYFDSPSSLHMQGIKGNSVKPNANRFNDELGSSI